MPLAELRSLIAKGGLQPADLVWSEHLPGWVPAREVPGLLLLLFCIIGAASGNPWTEGKTTVVRE